MKGIKCICFSTLLLTTVIFSNIVNAQTLNNPSQEKNLFELEEIVVVATREEEEIVRVPGNVTIITSEDIEKSTVNKITELLRKESGIMVTNTSGSTPTGITVETRGFNNGGGNGGRTLVLIDGWKANRADTNNPDWALIPVDNIERIEIIRGPASAVYGDSAMAGVINIITKGGSDEPAIEIGLDVGSWQRFGQKFILQGTSERFKYFFYGEHSDEDGYRDNSNYDASNLTGKFYYQLTPVIELNTKLALHNDDRELPGSLTSADIAAVGRQGSVVPGDILESDQFNFGLESIFIPDENNDFSIQFFFNNSERDSLSSYPGSGSTSINDDEEDYSLSLKYSSSRDFLGKRNKAVIGVDLLKEGVDTFSFSNYPDPFFPFIQRQKTKYERELIGAFIHDTFFLSDNIIFNAGVRYDRGDFEYNNTTEDLSLSSVTNVQGGKKFSRYSPKAAITYMFNDDISSYLSYARTFRFPNRDELTGFFGFTPELNPEKGDNFELGVKTRIGSKFNGGVSLYHMKIEGEIIYWPPPSGAFSFGQNENIDEVIHEGIEVSIESTIFPKTDIFVSYTFVDTEIREDPFKGSELPITPRHMGTVGLTFNFYNGFTFWNQVRLVGERYLANDLSNSIDKLSRFGVWDLKLSYEYIGNMLNCSAFVSVNNVLNKEYSEYGGIGGFPFGSRLGYYPSPNRNWTAGLEITF